MNWVARRRAAQRAGILLASYGVEEPEHIRLEDIAFDQGIEVVRGALTGSVARITRQGSRARVRLPEEASSRDRFSLAHELGHHCLHQDALKVCTEANMADWHSDEVQEVEANAFAAELLMPRFMLERRDEIWEFSLASAKAVARDFGASLSSAAVRLVELARRPCAVALVSNTELRWMIRNPAYWPGLRRRRSSIPRGSVVARVVQDGLPPGEHAELVEAAVWCPDDAPVDGVEFLEEVVAMPRLGLALVLLDAAKLPPRGGSEDDEDDEEGPVPWIKQW